ncbi:SDR family NAD(P)-dependent oxidoreductase [Nocardia seriolae]|uniref:Short-chain dehydrogenase n=1 Tax=Nocardia seriolae TaxID=37332 RepID=A0A0B8N3G8_9NOCA|nr:SDR family NAD(P)-dependent oxidoreductase [Nocardia seriolae]MTJ61237.1 SDR family NAD(P)-dependent oxidoreductase [Nocardia seriolae]MTJ69994.1 SDR family NAD(P)-dependent oxidoreductase [Nocardia seriolae]MTJ90638.1 SDR family NAD(P)-dependent oxidoreductase [Nocardia seriolae]MTK34599.1 SDR family NAD(P)-dependent oxidoreductase [Nocardia seriolae]MTK39214.1 SDR family NAD(P)-dependent oxidoreductase [Nocardia seriolae]
MRLNPFGGSRRTQQADAVVTGAGSGIGRGFALEIGKRGGRVVCSDIDAERARETVEMVSDAGGKAFDAVCDVSSLEQVTTLANTAEEWFGKSPDLVVNNAGIGRGGTLIGETPPAEWHQVLDINLWGVIHGCHVFTPRLRGAGHGSIVNVASAAAFGSAPRMAAYNVSKAGVLALSETLAAELSGTGVTVTVLCPTGVRTNILEGVSIGDENLQRWGDRLLRWTGRPPAAIARTTLDAVDRGQLYVVPQIEAKAIWQSKRLLPDTYTRAAGLLERLVR